MLRRAFWVFAAILVAVPVIAITSKIDAPTAQEQKVAADHEIRLKAFDEARALVLVHLRDPDSVKFGRLFITESGVVCGKFNSKNGFGGYTGFTDFLADHGMIFFDRGSQSPHFWAYWRQQCAGKQGYWQS